MVRNSNTGPRITDRALNRATLARQGLLARETVSAFDMVERLIGLQGQVHNAPYIGLWSRLENFRTADLETLLLERKVVRATLMRVTLHVATADDFLAIRPLVDAAAWRGFKTNHLKPLKGADVDEVRATSRRLLDTEDLTPAALGERLRTRWPEVGAIELSMPARFLEPVVHVPPAGLFGATKAPALAMASRWLGRGPAEPIAVDALALRYLKAFGPASGSDFNTWSGLTGGAAVMERLRPQLVSFTGADGRELFDLPDAPRPDEEMPAPARLLPDYDNVMLGYADRTRVLSAAAQQGLWRANGFRPAFTVDGFIRGSWKLGIGKETAKIDFTCFEPLRRKDKGDLTREAKALIKVLAPGRKAEITFDAVSPK